MERKNGMQRWKGRTSRCPHPVHGMLRLRWSSYIHLSFLSCVRQAPAPTLATPSRYHTAATSPSLNK